MRRSKIVCTLGPAVDSYEQLKALIEAGMNVARFNMSHGTHAEHEERYHRVRKASEDTGRAVGVLADLQGPKIRLETFAEGPVELVRGDEFTITTEDVPGDKSICGTTYKGLPGDVSKGDQILINDGNVELRVIEVDGPAGQDASSSRAGSSPTTRASTCPARRSTSPRCPRRTSRTCASPCGWAATWSRSPSSGTPSDVKDVHKVMDEEGRRVPVIAKVEKPQAVEQHGGRRHGVRRRDGGPRRPGRRVPAGEGPDGAEAAHRAVPPQRQAGDRGDPDDGVDDHQLPARPAPRRPTSPTRSWTARTRSCCPPSPRSARTRSRRSRRCRRSSSRPRRSCSPRASSRWSRARSRVPRAVRWPARPARSRTSWTARRWSPSPSPATRPAGCPATARRSRSWPSPRTSPPATS